MASTTRTRTTTATTTTVPTTTTNSIKETSTTALPAQTTTLRKLPKISPINKKSTLWPSTVDGIHEFAWGKSKDADDLFTFSPTPTPPTPTEANIYVEYIKKEFSQRMKGIASLTQPTLDPKLDEIQLVFKKLNNRKQTSTKTNEQDMIKDKGVLNPNQDTYDKPQHYIETITKQKKKEIKPHTIIKKTHITIDEVEQHSGAGNKSDSFEKHIELDESETDIEGQGQYDAATVLNDEGQTKMGSPFKILESQWGASHSQEADPWLPVAVSHAAVNIAKDMDKSFQPHGKEMHCKRS